VSEPTTPRYNFGYALRTTVGLFFLDVLIRHGILGRKEKSQNALENSVNCGIIEVETDINFEYNPVY
jgi:hypothetical protein